MGKVGAYLEIDREGHALRPAQEAVRDYDEVAVPLPLGEQEAQASRCMNCGVAFCQSGFAFPGARGVSGCPLHNLIPETNDLLCRGRLPQAAARLALTNPFPEFTGRVCPAPCEVACNLGLHEQAVTIHDDERAISDWAWANGGAGTAALPAAGPDAPLVSVVGSGPAGLAAAWELARRGLRVRLYERDDHAGGLLEYGIPEMKLPKDVVDRRVGLMCDSGIDVRCGVDAAAPGVAERILEDSAAVVLAIGARRARVPGFADLSVGGVCLAMDYLTASTREVLDGAALPPELDASGKDVAVIGGGDTGVDCVATALRQGARSVTQVIRAGRPDPAAGAWPCRRDDGAPAYGQAEAEQVLGSDPRLYGTDTLSLVTERPEGADTSDVAARVTAVRVQDFAADGRAHVAGTERDLPAQLVVIAKGFVGPDRDALSAFGASVAAAGKPLPIVKEGTHRAVTSGAAAPVYVAGDAREGSSLVVSAIADGLACAAEVARSLRG